MVSLESKRNESRAVEGRYQTNSCTDKARQSRCCSAVRRFGQKFWQSIRAFQHLTILSATADGEKLGTTLKENPNLLALYIKPVSGESLSVFRAEKVTREEIEDFSANAITNLGEKKIGFGNAQKISSSGEIVLPIVTPVEIDNKTSAAIVAIVSLREFSRIMAETKQTSEAEVWEAGLPMILCLNSQVNAIFHPELRLLKTRKIFRI